MVKQHRGCNTPIDFSYFDTNTRHSMQYWAIRTHGVLHTCSEADIRELPGVGDKRVARVKEYTRAHGFRLRYEMESFQSVATEVYGAILDTPVEALIVHLSATLHAAEGHCVPSRKVDPLHRRKIVVIGDFHKLSRRNLLEIIGGYHEPLYHSLRGWLLGMDIV